MMEHMATELTSQSDQVQFIADSVDESRDLVRKGNRHLAQATERPSTLRDFMLTIMAVLALALIFLDWYTP